MGKGGTGGKAGHLDFRDDSYRGTYWNQPPAAEERRRSSGNAVRSERLRQEKLTKAYGASKHDGGFKSVPQLDGMNARALRSMYDSTGGQSASWMGASFETSGTMRSLPTNIIDRPDTVNVNHIRATRQQSVWSDYYDGTRSFKPKTCSDNWVEERWDPMFKSGASELFEKRRYVTTSKDTLRTAHTTYNDAQRKSNMVAKLPVEGFDHRSTFRRRFGPHNYINYAPEDHTSGRKSRGGFWVGTAPADMYKTVSMTTYGDRKMPEFQQRASWNDTRSRMLCSLKPDLRPEEEQLLSYRNSWPAGGLASRRTEYRKEFTSYANNEIVPQMSDKLQAIHGMTTTVTDAGVQGHGHFISGKRM